MAREIIVIILLPFSIRMRDAPREQSEIKNFSLSPDNLNFKDPSEKASRTIENISMHSITYSKNRTLNVLRNVF